MQEKWLDETCYLLRTGVSSSKVSGPPISAVPNLTIFASNNVEMYSCYPTASSNCQGQNNSSLQVETIGCNIDAAQLNCNGYTSAYNVHSSQEFLPTKPCLTIIEQPVNRIRFRYKSEKGSHGGLTGRSSSLSKTYPTVKLNGYHGNSEIRVQASLFSCEEPPRRHVHKLMGRDCDANGVCTVSLRDDKTATFQNLGVLFTSKKEVPEILYKRKLEERGLLSCVHNSLLGTEFKELHEEAEREAKDLNLNCIKICFEAFIYNPDTNVCGVPLCDKVFSSSILNQKSPDSGELKIVKMDKYSGFCTGHEEVFLLCEKVNKKEIKIRFYETDADGKILWEDFGSFGEADVHHQVAIVFRTPPYKNTDIDNPVTVYVQLFRRKDGECSEPKSFVYKPVIQDEEGLDRKRKKIIHYQPVSGYGSMYSSGASTGFLAGDRENNGLGTGFFFGGHGQIPPTYQRNLPNNEINEFINSPEGMHSLTEESESQLSSPESADHIGSFLRGDPVFSTTNENCFSPNGVEGSTFLSAIVKDSVSTTSNMDKDITKIVPIQFLKIKEETSSFDTCSKQSSTEKTSQRCLRTEIKQNQRTNLPLVSSGSVTLSGRKAKVQQTECQNIVKNTKLYESNSEIGRNLALRSLNALRQFVISANITPLLFNIRQLIAVEDEDGDNLLHLAVLHQCHHASLMSSLLQVASDLPSDIINHSNNLKQTPLHLAVLSNSSILIKLLLMNGANPMLQDRNGNTAFHLSSKLKYPDCLSQLLCKTNYSSTSVDLKNSSSRIFEPRFINLNTLNYDGFSAVHLAVIAKSPQCIDHLCMAGADINAIDGTSGRTALHLAVEHCPDIVQVILSYPLIDVDIQDFAGNAPLHLACGRNLCNIAALLIRANANPLLENYDTFSDECDNLNHSHKNPQGKTPVDIAANNKEMASILIGATCLSSASEDQHANVYNAKKPELGADHIKNDSGYLSTGQVSFLDDETLSKLRDLMDPPSSDWEKLGSVLGLEQQEINGIKKLQTTYTDAVIKYFEVKYQASDSEKLEYLKNALDAADLHDGFHLISSLLMS